MKYLLDTDHISFLQRRSGSEHVKLTARITQHPAADFVFSIISFHEQIMGAHDFINRSKITANVVRGYNLLREIIQGFSVATILPFDTEAAAIFESLISFHEKSDTNFFTPAPLLFICIKIKVKRY
jgi:tRNA(fMet)-specific endonuclease VapC